MAKLPIIIAPDERLKVKADPVAEVDAEVRRLMDDMLETMYAAPGVGLAAPQVGVAKQVIVIDCAGADEPPRPLRIANPEILSTSPETETREEGCLSLPDQYADVERPVRVRVRYLDETNNAREIAAEGLFATCLQHEIDHLSGILFVDHVSRLKRDMILRKLTKARRTGAPVERRAAPVL